MRLIKSQNSVWAIHNGLYALPEHALDAAGQIVPEATDALGRANMLGPPEPERFALTAVVTSRCNLACNYCFQNVNVNEETGSVERIKASSWTANTIEQAARFVRQQCETNGLNGVNVLLFGGEPLLVVDTCVNILEALAPQGVHDVAIVSNGVLGDRHTICRLVDAGLKRIQVTFDGDRERHDVTRVGRRGEPSYDVILDNIHESADISGLRWQFRFNIGPDGLSRTKSVLNDVAQILDPRQCDVYFAHLRDYRVEGTNIQTCASDDLLGTVSDWVRYAIELGFSVLPPTDGFCTFCSEKSGRYGAVIGADGFLYSCWESSDREEMRVGHPELGYSPDESVLSKRWTHCGDSATSSDADSSIVGLIEGLVLDELAAAGKL